MKPTLNDEDFARAARELSCTVAAVKAVCQVEAPNGGFDADDIPRILFESHVFSRLTQHRYDKTNPSISTYAWDQSKYAKGATADLRNRGEHLRLQAAVALSPDAAKMSASWGRFQVLGENYKIAGFTSLQAFVNAAYAGESRHLDMFIGFCKSKKLDVHLRTQSWAAFAFGYNGRDYAKNKYDEKLAAAFKQFSGS